MVSSALRFESVIGHEQRCPVSPALTYLICYSPQHIFQVQARRRQRLRRLWPEFSSASISSRDLAHELRRILLEVQA